MRLAEDVGFSLIGVGDSQSLYREAYVMMAMVGTATRRASIGPAVTNPITRHAAVTASGIATIDEVTQGRAFLGVGSGDSSVLNIGERPAKLTEMRAYVDCVRALLGGDEVSLNGKVMRVTWPIRQVPIYMGADGPKTMELAGEICDGVFLNAGLRPENLRNAVAHVQAGALRAGRDPSLVDLWTAVRVNVSDDADGGLQAIRMELASQAHRLNPRDVPQELLADLRSVRQNYQPSQHEQVDGINADLVGRYPRLLRYLADRFAVVGTAEMCADKIRRIVSAGVPNLLFTALVPDRSKLIRTLGERVFPQVA
jgi:5,10-methylenetetrahydromethanopterin reductase